MPEKESIAPSVYEDAIQHVKECAECSADWWEFQAKLFGENGRLASHFTTAEELRAFIELPEFRKASELASLRPRSTPPPGVVRLTPDVWRSLESEARACGTTVEALCRVKLAMPIPYLRG